MKAEPVIHVKHFFDDGSIVEMVIWRLPKADQERPHALKYRLYYGKGGKCLVRYDNEKGKGDHRHVLDAHGNAREETYTFVSVKQLLADFKADIDIIRAKGEHHGQGQKG
jgi:hypothetical protein